jgi:hypothetical protein
MRESPLASRNSSAPYETPLNVWMTQKLVSNPSPLSYCGSIFAARVISA